MWIHIALQSAIDVTAQTFGKSELGPNFLFKQLKSKKNKRGGAGFILKSHASKQFS